MEHGYVSETSVCYNGWTIFGKTISSKGRIILVWVRASDLKFIVISPRVLVVCDLFN